MKGLDKTSETTKSFKACLKKERSKVCRHSKAFLLLLIKVEIKLRTIIEIYACNTERVLEISSTVKCSYLHLTKEEIFLKKLM